MEDFAQDGSDEPLLTMGLLDVGVASGIFCEESGFEKMPKFAGS